MVEKPSKNSAEALDRTEAKQGEIANQRRRGVEDIVCRVQSQVWLAVLKSHRRTPAGSSAIGRFFLPGAEDSGNIFTLIEKNSSNPGRRRASLENRSVVDFVGAKRGFAHTKLVYDSALWMLLKPTLPTPWEREEMIHHTLGQLMRDDKIQDPSFSLLVRVASDCRLPTPVAAYRRVVRRFARKRSITCVLLLCLLYRRATETGAVGEMQILREGVIAAVHHFCNQPGFSYATATVLLFLVRRRVLAGQRSLEHTLEMDYDADQYIAYLGFLCMTPEEYAWVDHQKWLVACALENLEREQVFEKQCELPLEVDRLPGWRDIHRVIARDAIARRLERVEL